MPYSVLFPLAATLLHQLPLEKLFVSLTQYSSSSSHCIQSPGHQERCPCELQQEQVWTLQVLNPGS